MEDIILKFNYENIKKAYQKHLFDKEVKDFLKREYGFEEKPKLKINKKNNSEDDFIREVKQNAEWIRSYFSKIESQSKNDYNSKNKIQALKEFMLEHEKRVGKEQAVKDLQRGLNILNGYKKDNPIIEERAIKEDGDWGIITNGCLKHICRNHEFSNVKKFVRTGAINNAYVKSCFDKRINVEKELDKIMFDLGKGE